jgi:hypothetical protein
MNSPFGKKVFGDDKPFDAARKLLKVLFPVEGALPVEGEAGKAIAAVANRLNRVTVAGVVGPNGEHFAVYLEGEITEDDYVRAAEQLAKLSNSAFKTEKLGGRKLLVLGEGDGATYGVRLSDSLFVVVYRKRDLIDEILDKHAGKKKAAIDKLLAERLKTVKTAETPVWLAIGALKLEHTGFAEDLSGLVGTIALKADADLRITGECATEERARKAKDTLDVLLVFLPQIGEESQHRVWKAAGIKVKQDGKTVTATGRIPAKLLAEEYAKQK